MRRGRWIPISLIGAFLLAISLTTPAAHAGVCSDLLLASKKYFSEVRESKGLRLLVAPRKGEELKERYLGFVSPKGWPAPFHGLNNVLIEKPTNTVVHTLAGPDKNASFLVKLPVLVGWLLLAQVYVIDPVTEYAFEERIQSEIIQNKAAFDNLIQNDYRFESIRTALAEGRLTIPEAEAQAYMVSRAYTSYYRYRDGKKGVFSDADNEGLLDHYLFGHLRPAIHDGVEVPPGFETSESFHPRLNEEQIQRLFKLTHALYFRYQIINAAVTGAPSELNEQIADLKADPFYKVLTALRQRNKISDARFEHALQEHAFWMYRLACYETMGLIKLNPATGKPAVLSDFDAEILADLQH